MKNSDKREKILFIVSIVLTCIGGLNAIATIIKNGFNLINVLTLVVYILVALYASIFYKKPHGNLLKYLMLVFALAYGIFAISSQGTQATGIIQILIVMAVTYIAGRLNRFSQNHIIGVCVLAVLLVLGTIDFIGVTNDKNDNDFMPEGGEFYGEFDDSYMPEDGFDAYMPEGGEFMPEGDFGGYGPEGGDFMPGDDMMYGEGDFGGYGPEGGEFMPEGGEFMTEDMMYGEEGFDEEFMMEEEQPGGFARVLEVISDVIHFYNMPIIWLAIFFAYGSRFKKHQEAGLAEADLSKVFPAKEKKAKEETALPEAPAANEPVAPEE